jgi:hypothetical protein
MPHGLSAPPFGAPGITDQEVQLTRIFIQDNKFVLEKGIWIDSAAVDAGSTPTTKLRAGLVLARAEAGGAIGKYVPLDHADVPAANDIQEAVILSYYVNMFGPDGSTVEDKNVAGVRGGIVLDSQLLYSGADAATQQAIKDVLPLVHFETDAP